MTCSDCKFYRPYNKDEGECFRHPPKAVVDPTDEPTVSFVRPVVDSLDFCGEYHFRGATE